MLLSVLRTPPFGGVNLVCHTSRQPDPQPDPKPDPNSFSNRSQPRSRIRRRPRTRVQNQPAKIERTPMTSSSITSPRHKTISNQKTLMGKPIGVQVSGPTALLIALAGLVSCGTLGTGTGPENNPNLIHGQHDPRLDRRQTRRRYLCRLERTMQPSRRRHAGQCQQRGATD